MERLKTKHEKRTQKVNWTQKVECHTVNLRYKDNCNIDLGELNECIGGHRVFKVIFK